jgi:2-methylaconitate cis-trans-isomerase PrpF
MAGNRLPAVFMRGGTSKALLFHARDLPLDRRDWDCIFLAVMGSPDPYGRQLNGMGGGISSLSKVCVVAPPTRHDADVDYTFAQVQVRERRVDYGSNCGNMSSAIGPFAVNQGLVEAQEGTTTVRINNTNTGKLIHATFAVCSGQPVEEGDLEIPGVAGTGAPVRLDFLDPGGACTGKLLPTGAPANVVNVPRWGPIEISMVDAANACAFVKASDIGLSGTELPGRIESDEGLLERLAAIRHAASVAMGIAPDAETAASNSAIPYIGFVSPPQGAVTLSGQAVPKSATDITLRMLSNGQPHRALPLTASLCAAVAACIDGTTVRSALERRGMQETLRIGMPSGVLQVGASVRRDGATWIAERGSFFRTARRLFEGFVYF